MERENMEPGRLPWDRDLPLISTVPALRAGMVKREAAHFVVREQEAYDPDGEGAHLFARITREGWSTRALRGRLSTLLEISEDDIGYAGLKDKRARVSQTFSLHMPGAKPDEIARRIEEFPGMQVDWIRPHRNKLKVGHLRGNHFQILMTETEPGPEGALEAALRTAREIQKGGAPNYFGSQRFGREGDNAPRGRRILRGERCRDPWLRDLLLSAFQSRLYNQWLGARIRGGDFQRLLRGDLGLPRVGRGYLDIEDPAGFADAFARGDMDYTGPMFGAKTPRAGYEAGELERRILKEDGIEPKRFARSGLTGGRRRGRLFPEDLQVRAVDAGLEFSFFLPKGAYATVLLREFLAPGGLIEYSGVGEEAAKGGEKGEVDNP